MLRIAFSTLGCKVNYVDTEAMIAACRRAGLEVVSFDEEADAYVVNTCTVTAVAEQQSRQLLRRPKRTFGRAFVVATGCAGEVDRDALASLGADAVFGTKDRDRALLYIFERLGVVPAKRHEASASAAARQSRARAFLKIQEGCDRRCAYCIVPSARGAARSVSPDEIERSCLSLALYHREIVLTGIDIGQYLWLEPEGNKEPQRLADLLQRLIQNPEIPRLRISSVDPTIVDEGLISLFSSSSKLCRHVHLSIQSGSDAVLSSMGRRYGAADVERAVGNLCFNVPNMAVTGDVIAGFPGEGEAQHEETARLLENLPLAGLHVFPYSEREGTRAAEMPGRVPLTERRARAARLRSIARDKRRVFLEKQIGQALTSIVTSSVEEADGSVKAFSDNAISISLPGGVVSYGEAGRAIITGVKDLGAEGLWDSQPKTRTSSSGLKSASAINSSAEST